MDEAIDDSWDDILDVLVTSDDGYCVPNILTKEEMFDDTHSFPKDSQAVPVPPSKKRKANPDADDIAKATEEALMQLGLDPNCEEFKLKKRQIRNRISAQSHRDRKNHHIVELEDQIAAKDKRISELEAEVSILKEENDRIRSLWLRNDVCRTASDLTTRTDVESLYSSQHLQSSPVTEILSSNHSCSNGSQTPDYSVSSYSNVPISPSTMTISSGGNSSLSNPLLKSLSFICVLCVLCLCSNMQSGGLNNSPNFTSGVDDELVSRSRRLLMDSPEEFMSTAVFNTSLDVLRTTFLTSNDNLATDLTASSLQQHEHSSESGLFKSALQSENAFQIAPMNHTVSTSNLRRRKLPKEHRKLRDNNSSANVQNEKYHDDVRQYLQSLSRETLESLLVSISTPHAASSSSFFQRLLPAPTSTSSAGAAGGGSYQVLNKDFLSFPVTQSASEDWFSYQRRIQSLSKSQVFMRNGMALLDPGFRPADPLAALLLIHEQQQQQQQLQHQQKQREEMGSNSVELDNGRQGFLTHPLLSSTAPTKKLTIDNNLLLPHPADKILLPQSVDSADAMDVDAPLAKSISDSETTAASSQFALIPAVRSSLLAHSPQSQQLSFSESTMSSSPSNNALDLVVPRLASASLQDSSTATSQISSARRFQQQQQQQQQQQERSLVQLPHTSSSSSSSSSSTTSSQKNNVHGSSHTASAAPSAASSAATTGASSLVAESNLVTLTIPATSIKIGRSVHDSVDSSMDSLLQLFNLSSPITSSQGHHHPSQLNTSSSSSNPAAAVSLQHAWVEMNCIVVGAKMMWPQQTTSSHSASSQSSPATPAAATASTSSSSTTSSSSSAAGAGSNGEVLSSSTAQ